MKSSLLILMFFLVIPMVPAQNVIKIKDICNTSSIEGVDLIYRYCLPQFNYQNGNSEIEVLTVEIFNQYWQSEFPSDLYGEEVDFLYIDYLVVITRVDDNSDFYTIRGNRTVTEADYVNTFHETYRYTLFVDAYEKSFKIEREYSITHSLKMGYTLVNGTERYVYVYPDFVSYDDTWQVVSTPVSRENDPRLIITWTNWTFIGEFFTVFSAVGLLVAIILAINFKRIMRILERRKERKSSTGSSGTKKTTLVD